MFVVSDRIVHHSGNDYSLNASSSQFIPVYI